jgi:hypothetical protein
MSDGFKITSIGTAENDFVTSGIPPQKPTDIMLKIRRELISIMDNNHCTYVNNRCLNTSFKNAAKSMLSMQCNCLNCLALLTKYCMLPLQLVWSQTEFGDGMDSLNKVVMMYFS